MYGGRSHRVDPYQAALAELRQLDLVEVEGARVRARVRWDSQLQRTLFVTGGG